MSTIPMDRPALDAHEEIEALLPWYVNGALTPDDTATVERHCVECPTCRAELEQCRLLAAAVQHNNIDEIWQPSPGDFDRLLADIDRLEAKPALVAARSLTLFQRLRDWLGATPNSVRWTLALESLAVAGLLLAIALPLSRPTPDYETLSSSTGQPVAGPRLRVIFANAATMGEIQEILRSIDGSIVAGPTALGVYTVVLPVGARLEPTLAPVLVRLRGLHQIKLAESIAEGG
ncbi:MAG: zf-HC2 domain-containing protein [Candidatus Competibacter phosphatis]